MKNSRQQGALLIRWEDFQNRVPLHVTQHGSVKEANAVGAAFKKSRRRRYDVIPLTSIK